MRATISFISFPVEEREVRLPTTSPRWVAQILGRVKMGRGGEGLVGPGTPLSTPLRQCSVPEHHGVRCAVAPPILCLGDQRLLLLRPTASQAG